MTNNFFSLRGRDRETAARVGTLTTPHGSADTPFFMAVGTRGAVRCLSSEDLLGIEAPFVLANTYHLYLRPGHELVREMGGLHAFMNWPRPILTDSGGYQVFSLSSFRTIREDGVVFRSLLDGSTHELTPAKAIDIQHALGADIIMCLDECLPYPSTEIHARDSMRLTVRWAAACLERHRELDGPARLFGIVQGGIYPALRGECAELLAALDFPGYAIGGLSVGEPKEELRHITAATAPLLPAEKPRYLMGVGYPEDIVRAVGEGIDMFDCVLPTRVARNGTLLTGAGRMNIKSARFARDPRPAEEGCDCPGCSHYSRAYLRHLYNAGEILVLRLNTMHNLRYYYRLMSRIRRAIQAGEYRAFRDAFLASPEAGPLADGA